MILNTFKKLSVSLVLFFLIFAGVISSPVIIKAQEKMVAKESEIVLESLVVEASATTEIDSQISAQKTVIYFFSAESCPHCKAEREFLAGLSKEGVQFELIEHEITSNKESARLLAAVAKELGVTISSTPFTVIGDQYVAGYLSDESSGAELAKLLDKAKKNKQDGNYINLVERVQAGETSNGEDKKTLPEKLDLPIFGEVNLKTISLPLLTFFIALLDGFNPCAMWTLLFLISLLLGMKDRKRMWLLGTTFIVASGFVYFLFMSAWLNLFLFLGFIVWVRIMIGLAALGTGSYYLRDFWKNKDGACSLEDNEKKQKTFTKLKEIALKESLWLALAGIIMLAFAVNLVELICSAGLPAIYTQVLSSSDLPTWQYYAYLGFYIFIFMLDDLIVFVIAMVTLQAVGLNSKYARFSHLIGGILMLIIGLLMIFRPEWLMLG